MDDGKGFQSHQNQVDYRAAAHVAPRRTLAEANGNAVGVGDSGQSKKAVKPAKPRWGGAEICPRCDKSVSETQSWRIFSN